MHFPGDPQSSLDWQRKSVTYLVTVMTHRHGHRLPDPHAPKDVQRGGRPAEIIWGEDGEDHHVADGGAQSGTQPWTGTDQATG